MYSLQLGGGTARFQHHCTDGIRSIFIFWKQFVGKRRFHNGPKSAEPRSIDGCRSTRSQRVECPTFRGGCRPQEQREPWKIGVQEIRYAVGSWRRESDGKVVNFVSKVLKYVGIDRHWLVMRPTWKKGSLQKIAVIQYAGNFSIVDVTGLLSVYKVVKLHR